MKKTGIIFITFMLFCMMLNGCSNGREISSEGVESVTETDAEESKEPIKNKLEVDIPDDFVVASEEELSELPDKEFLMGSETAASNRIGVQTIESVSYGNYEKLGTEYMIDAYVVTDIRNLIIRNQYLNNRWSVIYINDADNGNMYYPVTGKNVYDYITGESINPQEKPEGTEKAEKPVEETPHRDGMYGISDKDIHNIDGNFSANKVRNDVTGNWRISTIAANVNMVDYALSYYKKCFYDDEEIHGIVNFNNNTTTCIKYMSGLLYVTVYEYVDGEEHDADIMYSGTVLEDYIVYPDNGDIEKIQ